MTTWIPLGLDDSFARQTATHAMEWDAEEKGETRASPRQKKDWQEMAAEVGLRPNRGCCALPAQE